MKKLMVVAGVIALAVSAQAAKIQWSTTNTKAGYLVTEGTTTTSVGAGLTTYIFDTKTIGAEAAYNLFLSGGEEALAKKAFGEGVTASGKIDTTTTVYGGENTDYTFFAAIVASNEGTDYVYFTQEKDGTTGGNPDVASSWAFANQNSTSAGTYSNAAALDSWGGTGHWYAAAVPEPTSGLLLLLGVAGLALRRRRA